MQRHKKWLVITIWISTIAFIGAGFVGWGSYEYGKKGGVVAVVGDREISMDEYQREYSNLYDQYSKMLGGQFTQEMAKQFNLSNIAYKLTLQKNLLLSYADELGLDVTNEDIAKEVMKYKAFQKDGKFDKDIYVKVLLQNQSNPIEFENSLKRNLLLGKLESILQTQAQNKEIENIAQLLFLEDNINVMVLDANMVQVTLNQDELKKYWETNKNNYMSRPSYELETKVITLLKNEVPEDEITSYYSKFKNDFKKEDGKLKTIEEAKAEIIKAINLKETKKEALKTYLDVKKGKATLENKAIVFDNELNYAPENNKEIEAASKGALLKPFLFEENYLLVRVNDKFEAKALSYQDALPMVTKDFMAMQKQIQIAQKAQTMLENFKGENIGYVNRSSINKIPDLNSNESAEFLNKLFAVSKPKGVIDVANKIVLYKINNSKFAVVDNNKLEAVKSSVNNLQNAELMNNLVNDLESRYTIQSSLEESKDK